MANNNFGKFMLGTLIGGALGAVIGMLMAPRSGVETREIIRDEFSHRYTDSMNQLNTTKEQLRTKMGEVGEKVKSATGEFEEAGRRAISRWKEKGQQSETPMDAEATSPTV